jgi:hypothetical protein
LVSKLKWLVWLDKIYRGVVCFRIGRQIFEERGKAQMACHWLLCGFYMFMYEPCLSDRALWKQTDEIQLCQACTLGHHSLFDELFTEFWGQSFVLIVHWL